MGSHVAALTGLVENPGRFDVPHSELRPAQIAAAQERFATLRPKIKLLDHRAGEAGLERIGALADLVPLLFAHSSYKSYPDTWLLQGNWKRLGRWLGAMSAVDIDPVSLEGASDLDDWLSLLEVQQIYVSCSSGTTGKCSMIAASAADRAFVRRNTALALAWSTGTLPDRSFRMVGTVPVPDSPRNRDVQAAYSEEFGDGEDFRFPSPPITIGQVSQMVAMRRAIAEGSATPAELDRFESLAAQREIAMAQGSERTVDALAELRGRKLFIGAQYAMTYRIAEAVRARGLSGTDFHPDNVMAVGGGLKGATLPEGYQAFIGETFNVRPERVYRYYGMQEINTTMPICRAGRYHVPPWLILLLLDRTGDSMIPAGEGEHEGRAGFLDLSIEGRWGGVISGDRISVRYGKCDCGHQGPTIGDDVTRYADLGDGDKITCAGTIDAYVRGIS
ncbi:MAG: hypothetical protein AB7F98_00920 [Novosphingobium sp.]